MAKFDDIFNDIKKVFFKDAKGRFRKKSIDDFHSVKNQIIGAIAEHKATNAIENNGRGGDIGISGGASNFSLFGALGFEVGRSPKEEIINYLKNEIDIVESPDGKTFYLKIPDKEEIYSTEELYLQGRSKSWVFYMEEGIDNLSFYYEKPDYGRSEVGFQNKSQNNLGLNFNGVSYVTDVIKQFQEKYKGSIKFI